MGAELSKTSLSEEEERACRQKGRDMVLDNLYGPSRKRAPARKDSVATMTGNEVTGANLALVTSHFGVESFEGTAQNPAVCEESEDDKDEEDGTAVVPADQDKSDSFNTIRPDDEEPDKRHSPDYQSSALRTPQVLMGGEYNGGGKAGVAPADEGEGGYTTQSQMGGAAQDPSGVMEHNETEIVVVAAEQETLDAMNSIRNDSEEREEATPMNGIRKPFYRPRQGPFVRSEVEWAGLSRQMQQRWSSTNRIHKFGRTRAPTCRRCRRDHAKGRQMESPCKVWLAGGLGKCQWCTLDGRPCVD
ncbi:unnamed protein product [Zymoseptoria tritici ST99CH_3D7]|uniref:Uncharacterized protein n=1 Tax=Zymoseptoria tritici (strain ST99CH_3D7) TaxID=1276538 RepID=A0A1X7RPK8_ZYMT9|nr:unnamed protein product [Zymoseptoria tritici ST99CH_3D7]